MPQNTYVEPSDESVVFVADSISFKETLACGQTFAFFPDGDSFLGVADGKPVMVEDASKTIRCRREDEVFWRRYFDMDRDYDEILAPYLATDPYLAACVNAFPGIRVLRQPVWETVCAFIVSANNNQPRITGICRNLATRLGERFTWEGRDFHGFPSPQRLAMAGEYALREAGAGYRASYMFSTAKMVADGFSLDLDDLEYEAALHHLMMLPGVGEKVADCILLFSSRHTCAFPVDVWIERALNTNYGLSGSRSKIKKEAQARFGANCGILQQYLFHGVRSGSISAYYFS